MMFKKGLKVRLRIYDVLKMMYEIIQENYNERVFTI